MMQARENELDRGRTNFSKNLWSDAFASLTAADAKQPLAADDLERLATCAILLGDEENFCQLMERAHQAHVEAGNTTRAIRSAFWIGLTLVFRRQTGPATGWLGRANRLLTQLSAECAETGYLLLPVVHGQIASGDLPAALQNAGKAVAVGERFTDKDLVSLARQLEGRIQINLGNVEIGLALLDETMVAVTAGELSPRVTGIIYCNVIEGCREVFALGRSSEWTAALTNWCARQPSMVAFTGKCLVHRAEIMRLHGEWTDAVEEAARACERFSQDGATRSEAAAVYEQAEVFRLRGDYEEADKAYQRVQVLGRDPQPGYALLQLALGQAPRAEASICRSVESTSHPLQRARLLDACVEIKLATGDLTGARTAFQDLADISARYRTEVLSAIVQQVDGAIKIYEGDEDGALEPLRAALQVWLRIEAPYAAARVREWIGQACRAVGEEASAQLEWTAAMTAFEKLGAIPDAVRVRRTASTTSAITPNPAGLTERESEVLRLVAAGKTNKQIAAELFLSVKTVDRHVSNLFNKLNVSTRSAATAYAYEHNLAG